MRTSTTGRSLVRRVVIAGAALIVGLAAALAALEPAAAADATTSKQLAPGFSQLGHDDRIVVMPVDVELFSLSAGGITEPRADWTAAAHAHMKAALAARAEALGLKATLMDEAAADEFGELVSLHAAVARSIALHHGIGGGWALPTKGGRLDWSFGDVMQPLAAKTGARYGLFVRVRDSYASNERKAAMVALALLGIGIGGGAQVGYASLVDLQTGRVVWFNRLLRVTGDLREARPAAESMGALLAGFPPVQ